MIVGSWAPKDTDQQGEAPDSGTTLFTATATYPFTSLQTGLGHIRLRSRWDRAHGKYTCADGKKIRCDFRTVLVNLDLRPRNGV